MRFSPSFSGLKTISHILDFYFKNNVYTIFKRVNVAVVERHSGLMKLYSKMHRSFKKNQKLLASHPRNIYFWSSLIGVKSINLGLMLEILDINFL